MTRPGPLLLTAAAAALLAAAQPAPAAPPCEVEEHINITYRPQEPKEILPFFNKLDLYAPRGVRGYPVVVLVHGGAWSMGDKVLDFLPEVARSLARQGIGAVVPNYRLSPYFKHPAHARDVAKAVAWTHAHIAAHGGRADRLFLAGHSAGGHLVALLATDDSYLKAEGLNRGHVAGVVGLSGVYQITEVGLNVLLGPARQLRVTLSANPFRVAFGGDLEVCRQASPLTHVCPGLPPFLVLYADDDLPTLGEMAERFTAALAERQCPVRMMKVPARNHSDILWKARHADDPVGKALVEFVRANGR